MTIEEAKDQAARNWNEAFDFNAMYGGVSVGNIKMIHLKGVIDEAIELYANQFKTSKVEGVSETKSAEDIAEEIMQAGQFGGSLQACAQLIEIYAAQFKSPSVVEQKELWDQLYLEVVKKYPHPVMADIFIWLESKVSVTRKSQPL